MKHTNKHTAGPAEFRGPFSGPFSVQCIGPHCAYWLKDFNRSGLHGRLRHYATITAARIAARLEARRMARAGARIDAAVIDADGRTADAFTNSGPWESAGPIDPFKPDYPARACLIYPGRPPVYLAGAYRTLRGAQAAARRAFRAAVAAASEADGPEAADRSGGACRARSGGPKRPPEAPESVRIIDTSRNDWDCPDGAIWAELGAPNGRWITY